jgi:hypothetical protein
MCRVVCCTTSDDCESLTCPPSARVQCCWAARRQQPCAVLWWRAQCTGSTAVVGAAHVVSGVRQCGTRPAAALSAPHRAGCCRGVTALPPPGRRHSTFDSAITHPGAAAADAACAQNLQCSSHRKLVCGCRVEGRGSPNSLGFLEYLLAAQCVIDCTRPRWGSMQGAPMAQGGSITGAPMAHAGGSWHVQRRPMGQSICCRCKAPVCFWLTCLVAAGGSQSAHAADQRPHRLRGMRAPMSLVRLHGAGRQYASLCPPTRCCFFGSSAV